MVTTRIKAASIVLAATSFAGCVAQSDSSIGESASPAVQASDTEFHSFEVKSLAKDRNISLPEARLRLGWQLKAPGLEEDAARQLGDTFGGLWIDIHDGDRVKLGVVADFDADAKRSLAKRGAAAIDAAQGAAGDTTSSDSEPQYAADPLAAARALVERHGLSDATDIVEVNFSFEELEAVNTWVSGKIVDLGRGNTLIAGLRTDLNAVVISTIAGLPASVHEEALLDEAFDTFGDRLVLDTHPGVPQIEDCTDIAGYGWVCDPALRGGIRIRSLGGCTGAFIARGRIDNELYQFTAGHCVDTDSGTWSTRFPDNSTHNIGTRKNFHYGTSGDVAILNISNETGWDLPENWVHVTDGDDTTEEQDYSIASEGGSSIGMRICITGASSDASDCGEVTQLGVTYTNNENVTITNAGRASYCSISGDSGAPLYAGQRSYGLHNSAFPCDGFYTGINRAENLMNVDVLH